MKTEVSIHILELARAFDESIVWFSNDFLVEISHKVDRELEKRKKELKKHEKKN